MERTPVLCLLVTMFAFYLLVPSNAVPLSRLQRMDLQEAGEMPSVKGGTLKPTMEMERFLLADESMIPTRMDFETQDYSPPGPNNHHKPPGWS